MSPAPTPCLFLIPPSSTCFTLLLLCQVCSLPDGPTTGWRRDGYCNTDDNDQGHHCVCSQVTQDFLDYTKAQGNDLSTPQPHFPGLKAGDRWYLCYSTTSW